MKKKLLLIGLILLDYTPNFAQNISLDFFGEQILSLSYETDSIILRTYSTTYYSKDGILFSNDKCAKDLNTIKYNYVINGSTLEIYYPYMYANKYKGTSIRTIGRNYVGGYNIIEINHVRLKSSNYCSGKIRNIDNKYFICFDGIIEYNPIDNSERLYSDSTRAQLYLGGVSRGLVRDIQERYGSYYILTSQGLYKTTKSFQLEQIIFQSKNEFQNCAFVKVSNEFPMIHFIHEGGLFSVNTRNMSLTKIPFQTIENYNEDDKHLYLHGKGFSQVLDKSTFKVIDKISGHFTALFYDNSNKYIGFTQEGLYVFHNKTKLQLNKIEYNRRAFEVNKDTIYAGSTIGLFLYSRYGLYDYASTISHQTNAKLFSKFIVITCLLIITLLTILIIVFRRRKIIKRINLKSRIEIEAYVMNNLPVATVENVCMYFGITKIELLELFKEQSLAQYIKKLRLDIVRLCYEKEMPIEEASRKTGYSKTYLVKYVLPQLKKQTMTDLNSNF